MFRDELMNGMMVDSSLKPVENVEGLNDNDMLIYELSWKRRGATAEKRLGNIEEELHNYSNHLSS